MHVHLCNIHIYSHIQNFYFACLIKLHLFYGQIFILYQRCMNFTIDKLCVSFSGYAKFNFVDVKSQSNGTSIYIQCNRKCARYYRQIERQSQYYNIEYCDEWVTCLQAINIELYIYQKANKMNAIMYGIIQTCVSNIKNETPISRRYKKYFK